MTINEFSSQATVLEEMPPFPERESSILAKLKKKKQEKTGIVEKEDKPEPVEKPTTNGQVPVVNEVCCLCLIPYAIFLIRPAVFSVHFSSISR